MLSIYPIKSKIRWVFRRHPILYYIRFALICENISLTKVDEICFNAINNKEDVPEIFNTVFKEINLNSKTDFEKALEIALYLKTKIVGGRGLGLSSDAALSKMIAGKGGVCSDFSQIFNVFCLLAEIKVREWGVVEKFYDPKYGHTFNEIYCTQSQKWIMLDVGKSFYYVNPLNKQPLSALDLFKNLRNNQTPSLVYFIIENNIDERLPMVYSCSSIPFLISNYNNKVYDFYFNKYQDRFPGFLINFWLILTRKNFRFSFMLDNYKKFF